MNQHFVEWQNMREVSPHLTVIKFNSEESKLNNYEQGQSTNSFNSFSLATTPWLSVNYFAAFICNSSLELLAGGILEKQGSELTVIFCIHLTMPTESLNLRSKTPLNEF